MNLAQDSPPPTALAALLHRDLFWAAYSLLQGEQQLRAALHLCGGGLVVFNLFFCNMMMSLLVALLRPS